MSNLFYNVRVHNFRNHNELNVSEKVLNTNDLFDFQKIQTLAQEAKGLFSEIEIDYCDYSFDSKESALSFIFNIKKIFKNEIAVMYLGEREKENSLKEFKKLPPDSKDRLREITPSSARSLPCTISFIDSDSLSFCESEFDSNKEKDLFKCSYANLKCKFSGKVKSNILFLRSVKKVGGQVFNRFIKEEDVNEKLKLAKDLGWNEMDIYYDSIINGIFINDVFKETYNGQSCPEIIFASTHANIVISISKEDVYVGWFFYNENIDEILDFTNYSL